MAPEEQAIEWYAAAWAWPLRVIGLLIWSSTLVYAVVIALIHAFSFLPAEAQSDEEALFVRILALLFFLFGLASAPLTWKVRQLLLRSRKWASLLAGGAKEPPLVRWHLRRIGMDAAAPGLAACRRETFTYFQASLIALAIAEAPGIFALVLALIQMFRGPGLSSHPLILAAILVMAAGSLALKWTVLPTKRELTAHLKGTASRDDEGEEP